MNYSGTPFEMSYCQETIPSTKATSQSELNMKVFIISPEERPPILKGYISGAKWVASQEGFYCILSIGHDPLL